jgi:hypothetical protein
VHRNLCSKVMLAIISVGLISCSNGASTSSSSSSASCATTSNTTETTASSNGCYLLSRDTSSCQASRTSQGLSGFWLKFSCRVTLTKSGSNVIITADSQPDHKSPYFATSNACYASGFPSGRAANPNTLASQSISMTVPFSPTADAGTTGNAMSLGIVGIALNGVVIFSNAAAGTDDIYAEVYTFDKCEGHPAGTKYHYHTEPTTASNSDNNFIGVMRDGFPIYGRYDTGSVTPTLNKATAGGHLGTTVDSPSTSVYHYHINLQTSPSGTYAGDTAYFITTGFYMGTAGACTGC